MTGQGDHMTGQGDHKGSPLLWTNGLEQGFAAWYWLPCSLGVCVCAILLLLGFFDQAYQVLQLFDGVFRVLFIAVVAIGGELAKPGEYVLF
jgi:hypothetical protein